MAALICRLVHGLAIGISPLTCSEVMASNRRLNKPTRLNYKEYLFAGPGGERAGDDNIAARFY